MVKQSSHQVKTFSIGFPIKDFDESQYAKQVADHLGTDHEEILIQPEGYFPFREQEEVIEGELLDITCFVERAQ